MVTIEADKKKEKTTLGKIMSHEGFRLNPYKDTKGYLTGGTGHKMTAQDIREFDPKWSDDEKYQYWTDKFDDDYSKASSQAIGLMNKRGIDSNATVEGVLVNMIFNMGVGGVSKFNNFLTALSDKNYEDAIYEMKHDSKGNKSPYYKDVGRRVDELAEELKSI